MRDTQATESGCDGWNTKPSSYTQMLQSVIGSSIKADSGNGDIYDLQLTPQVCTNDVLPLVPENETLLGVHILVDSICWRQSHPNEMNVSTRLLLLLLPDNFIDKLYLSLHVYL